MEILDKRIDYLENQMREMKSELKHLKELKIILNENKTA